MTLGILLVILAILAAVVVAAPFLRRRSPDSGNANGIDVYKDQLAEVERDLEQGAIGKEEAALARVEIERRILNAAQTGSNDDRSLGHAWHYRIVTGLAAVVVLGSVGIYGVVGHADRFYAQQARDASGTERPIIAAAESQPAEEPAAATTEEEQLKQVETMVKQLQERLAANPEDADGWRVLGWSYYNLGAFDKSIEAYKRSSELQKDNPLIRALLGEAMVKQAGGAVTDEALAVFDEVLALKSDDERALFFKGLAQEQRGNPQGAIDQWIALYATAPKDAEWAADLRGRIETVAQASKIDVSARLQKAAETKTASADQAQTEQRGPTPEDVENAKQMAPEDQNAMVRGMVDGLAARLESSPDDPDGWIMLMRSHIVLNEQDKAQAALERATEALAGSPEKVKQIADAAKVMGLSTSNQ
jgi:cytochrome c-type biogenesis protein CcmH